MTYSKKRESELIGRSHRGKLDGTYPYDKDNLEKAFLDALFPGSLDLDDSHIWDGRVSKLWAPKNSGYIEVRIEDIDFDATFPLI